MSSSRDFVKHTCSHCQEEVLTVKGCMPGVREDWDHKHDTIWRLPLNHKPDRVREAALAGCPFFEWLWGFINNSYSNEEMLELELFFLLKTVKLEQAPLTEYKCADDNLSARTPGRASHELYEITGCQAVTRTKTGSKQRKGSNFTAVSDWDDPSAEHALARLIDGHTSSSQVIGQIQRRLQHCLVHHDSCKAAFSDIRPRRFLSVGESNDSHIKVTRAWNLDNRDTEPYAALSYCWGQDQAFKLTSTNKAYMEVGFPLSLLPKTITDAIRVTREIGIKLLWVDSLCLVQDDVDELAKEIAKMHHFFGNAHITISAATPASCTEGFLHDHASPRAGACELGDVFYFPLDPEVSEDPSYLKLIIAVLEWQAINSRTWTLQKGILSHRLVSFDSRVVRWSCRTTSYGRQSLDSLRNLYESLAAVCSGTEGLSDHGLAWEKLKVWCNIVDCYTLRALSNEEDKLPAISGIASVLSALSIDASERSHKQDIVAGLLVHCPLAHPPSMTDPSRHEMIYQPRDYFESGLVAFQLLWIHECSKEGYWNDGPGAKTKRHKQRSQNSPYIAPSWSWAGHMGPTDTQIPDLDESKFEDFSLLCWEQGLRVHEVRALLSHSEAPYGALTGGSITLEGRIFRADGPDWKQITVVLIRFDDGGWEGAPVNRSGLFCLEFFPKHWHRRWPPFKRGAGFSWKAHGLVLKLAELGSRSPGDKAVYRRVGVYNYNDFYDYTDDDIHGKFETITII